MTDSTGTCWLAYLEPAPPEKPLRRSAAVLPGRRLRFDSLDASLVVSAIPAGAPYLSAERLRGLLADARPVPAAPAPPAVSAIAPARALGSVDWAGSVAGLAGAVGDAVARRWHAMKELRRLCARGLVHAVAPAALLLIVIWETLFVRTRARI